MNGTYLYAYTHTYTYTCMYMQNHRGRSDLSCMKMVRESIQPMCRKTNRIKTDKKEDILKRVDSLRQDSGDKDTGKTVCGFLGRSFRCLTKNNRKEACGRWDQGGGLWQS